MSSVPLDPHLFSGSSGAIWNETYRVSPISCYRSSKGNFWSMLSEAVGRIFTIAEVKTPPRRRSQLPREVTDIFGASPSNSDFSLPEDASEGIS